MSQDYNRIMGCSDDVKNVVNISKEGLICQENVSSRKMSQLYLSDQKLLGSSECMTRKITEPRTKVQDSSEIARDVLRLM